VTTAQLPGQAARPSHSAIALLLLVSQWIHSDLGPPSGVWHLLQSVVVLL